MKRFLIFALACILLGTVQTSSRAQMSVPASRRREKTPLQFTFGNFNTVAPFNQTNGYTSITDDNQIQPSSLISNTNTFASTADFTLGTRTGFTQASFSVASSVGTVSGTGSQFSLTAQSSAATITAPQVFVQCTITQNGTATGTGSNYDVAGCGISKDGNNYLNANWDKPNHFGRIEINVAGTKTDLGSVSFTVPSAPWRAGFSLLGNQATFWENSGSGWVEVATQDVSSKRNFKTDGNMSGWQPGIYFQSNQATSWKFSNLVTGSYGGAGICDMTLVTYPDGRPYMRGSTAFFTADLRDVSGAAGSATNEVWSYDVASGSLQAVSVIMVDRGGAVQNDQASHLIYDPVDGNQRLLITTFGSSAFPTNINYASTSIASQDLLSPGVYVISGVTQMNLPSSPSGNEGYDPYMACTQWNYSASTCSKWLLAFTDDSSSTVRLQSSTSDPSVNSWTSVGSGLSRSEGSKLLRVSTGGSGVSYYAAFSGETNLTTRNSIIYDASMNLVGSLNVTWPAGSGDDNPSHPQIFSYGNTEYLVTFNDNRFGTVAHTMGNFLVSTSPKYSGNSSFQLANIIASSSSLASASTNQFSVDKGSLVVAVCRGGSVAGITLAASSSPSATWTTVASVTGTASSAPMLMAYATAPSDQMTVTCTPSASDTFLGAVVLEVPTRNSADSGATWSGTFASATSATSGSWSTAETATGIFCITTQTTTQQYMQAGSIAGSTAQISGNNVVESFCESRVLASAASGQTASLSWDTAAASVGIFGAFK